MHVYMCICVYVCVCVRVVGGIGYSLAVKLNPDWG